MTTQDEQTDQTPETSESPAESSEFPETALPKESVPESPRRNGPGAGALIFLVALLPGVAALSWLVWQHFQDAGVATEFRALDLRLDELAERVSDHEDSVGALSSTLEGLRAQVGGIDIAPLQREIDAYRDDLTEMERRLDRRLQAMGGKLDELDLDVPDTERRLPLLEAGMLLRLGQDRLELAGDAAGARQAFERARERLALSDDPRVGAVSRQIAREVELIAAWRAPDWPALSGRLRALSDAVPAWTLKTAPSLQPAEPEERRSFRGRAQRALSSLVTIRRTDEIHLTPADAEQLRATVQARLAAAELEAARRDSAALAANLAPVFDVLNKYFDGDHVGVQAAKQGISELLAAVEPEDPPVVGEAARQLQALL